jgi:hypothetical protein
MPARRWPSISHPQIDAVIIKDSHKSNLKKASGLSLLGDPKVQSRNRPREELRCSVITGT